MINTVSALPSKRIYRSIMQDYNLLTAICELIDNVIDNWKNNWKDKVKININFDSRKSTIIISDNSWWIENLEYVIAPWKTWNSWDEEVIWIFWVGSKRAAIALASHIKFRTFFDKPFYIQYDDDWLKDEEKWNIDLIDDNNDLTKWTTQIELSKLRIDINNTILENLEKDLSFIYGSFLNKKKLEIIINWNSLKWYTLNNWWEYNWNKPIKIKYTFDVDWRELKLHIIAWIKTQTSSSWEYWVYFYWNNRLIAKEIKDNEVWYYTWKAWLPHPSASLGQFIISFYWPSNIIPWNSSKTWIVYSHEVYKKVRNIIEKLVIEYTKLSRKIVSSKDIDNINKFLWRMKSCKISWLKTDQIKTYLPEVPKRVVKFSLIEKNKELYESKPWLQWIIESFIAIEKISKLNLVQKNRIILILLDSNFEIWIKEYLVHEKRIWNRVFNNIKENRNDVITKVKNENNSNILLYNNLDKTNYYYLKRNDLIHQRTTANITDKEIIDYTNILQKIFNDLFWLKF